MPISSFYNDNLFRTYPLVTDQRSLLFPKKRIVGLKVCCSYASPFCSFPRASLTDWTVRGSEHRLTFLVESDDVRVPVLVVIPKSAPKFTHVFSEPVEETSVRITVGDLAGATESYSGLNLPVEPTLVLWLKHRGVRQVRIGNASRDRLPSCQYEGIPERQKTAYAEADWWRQEKTLTGPILLSEGFNCRLVAAPAENTLRFFPQAGAGMAEATEFISLGTTLIDGRSIPEWPVDAPVRPDGLPYADRLLHSFCGATGPEIEAGATESIVLRNDLDMSTVSIRVAALGSGDC